MAKEINYLEKNTEEFGDESEKRQERPHIRKCWRCWMKRRVREQRCTECNLSYVQHTEGQHFSIIFTPCKVIRNPGNSCLWTPESWALKSGIQLEESKIPLTIGIRNPVLEIRSPERGIQHLNGARRTPARKLNCLLILTTFQYYTTFLNVHWKLV